MNNPTRPPPLNVFFVCVHHSVMLLREASAVPQKLIDLQETDSRRIVYKASKGQMKDGIKLHRFRPRTHPQFTVEPFY